MKTTEYSSEIMKNSYNKPLVRRAHHRILRAALAARVAALVGLASVLNLQATILDNFNGASLTGWTGTPNLSYLTQSGGQLHVATVASANALTYGTKTSQSFANAANQTLEFRVDVNAAVPGSDNPNPVAILAWLPSGAVPGSGSGGYSLWATPAGATLYKGNSPIATTTYATPYTTNLQNTTLVLRVTPGSGGTISVNARVYRQTGSLPMQNFTEVWETTQTVSDSVGPLGYAALGVQSGASASGATVTFDNLQVFVLFDSVLDDFSGGAADLANNYDLTLNGPPVTISGGQMEIATYTYNNTIYSAARRATSNYEITDGSRLEISVDVVNFGPGASDPNAFGALSYTPFNNDNGVGYLIGYHIGAGVYGLSIGKAYGEWWVNQEAYNSSPSAPDFPIPSTNVRYILSTTGEGTSCRIDSRVEDLSVGVNDPARVLWQNVFVDTAGVDPFDPNTTPNYPDGTLGSASAYLNAPGSIALYAFYGGKVYGYSDIIYANLVVNQTAPVALPPSFNNIVPADRSNFVAVATGVSFHVNDAINTPVNNISLTLNGVKYANLSGATVGGTATSRTFTLTASLLPDTFYSGSMQATNSSGLVAVLNYSFDTFRSSTCYVIESEDFNFNNGLFHDNPVLYPDGAATQLDGYVDENPPGVEGVDYHDARTSADPTSTYRPFDNPRNGHTGDGPRAQYLTAGAPETVVNDRQNGDWMNYTHTYGPSGYYHAYMRMSQFNVGVPSQITLERLTPPQSDPTQPNQTTVVLGSFLGTDRGYDINYDVPLTDAFGNPVLVHFSNAVDTLRVHNVLVQGSDSELWQNYVVFAPAGLGSQPAYVAVVSPAPGAVLGINAPSTSATIVNRDTTVDTSSVIVRINGVTVPSSAPGNASGATVTWAPLSSSPTLTNTLIFKDNHNVWQTNTWIYSYGVSLQATNSLSVGSLAVRGFDARMVQSSAANIGGSGGLDNSLNSARAVLANPPQYAVDLAATNIVQVVAWDLNASAYGALTNFPGLCIPPANVNSYAIETFAYLQLTAGPHRFYVNDDDRAGVYSGANLTDAGAAVLFETPSSGTTFHGTFDFFVPASGLYPFRIIYEQATGAAYLVLHSVNLSDNSQMLVNTNAVGGVNAYYPLVCKSSTSVAGPYTVDNAANAGNVLTTADVLCDGTGGALNQSLTGGTLTVPISGTAKFYRLDGPRATKITSITKSDSNVIIAYQAQ